MSLLKQRLTGNEVRQLRDAVVDAFDFGDLQQVVFFSTNKRIAEWIDVAQTWPVQN